MCQGKMKFCKNVREMSGNFTFQPDEAGMFGPGVFFLAKFIKFSAPLQKFKFVSGEMSVNCQKILVSPKYMNLDAYTRLIWVCVVHM